jgi:hypothetical protein
MTLTTRIDYENTLTAIAACINARIPVLLWGNPGEGKTSMIESAAGSGFHVETVIISQSEPSDLAGLPVVTPAGDVAFAAPRWARRLAEQSTPSICFFDEFSTAAPSLQAAALRILTHGEVGALRLPETVAFVAAANPVDIAAAGWELAAPTASRFVHLDFAMPLEVFAEGTVTGTWPPLRVEGPPAGSEVRRIAEMARIAAFLQARPTQLCALPKEAAARGRAFPTPRTWDFAGRLISVAESMGASAEVLQLLAAGAVGESTAYEYLTWRSHLDLPDPDDLLDNASEVSFASLRPDRSFLVLQSTVQALDRRNSPERWTRAVELCCAAANQIGVESAIPAVRALMSQDRRPAGAHLPDGLVVFAAALEKAGVLA